MVRRISDPMAYTCNILLGRIIKNIGYEGAVAVKLEKIFTENIPRMESVFLEIEGRPVPFFISGSEYSGADILKLSFNGYDSNKKVSEFTGCRVFLTSAINNDNLKEKNENLIGYSVFVQEDQLLGSISEVLMNNGQWLINVISKNKKDILIPFHEHFIISINKRKKIIIMNIPEGLTEIN
jgi:16S rRNA processing protein RimM